MRIRVKFWLCLIGSILLFALSGRLQAGGLPEFTDITLDENIGKVCYAVTVADVNADGKPDPVALSENRLIWFENPSWKPHVILENQLELDHVCLAPQDIDGDGLIDFAVGAGWTKKGTIQWISRDKANPNGLWKVYPIAEELWTHRMRWADVLGTGKPQLTVSPLNKTEGEGVRLLAFEIPDNPRTDRWPPTVMSHELNKVHNHWHPARKNPDWPLFTVTASEEGISFLVRGKNQNEFKQFPIDDMDSAAAKGNPKGAGEIKSGTLRDNIGLYVSVEPFHGNELAAYVITHGDHGIPSAKRYLLTDQMKRGHALWLADLNNDGRDEIIIGHSDPGEGEFSKPSISLYEGELTARGGGHDIKWKRTILDDREMASEDLIAHDFNGDGWIDILAGGRNSHNVKLYLNRGLKRGNP